MPDAPITMHEIAQLKSQCAAYPKLFSESQEEIAHYCVEKMPAMIKALLDARKALEEIANAPRGDTPTMRETAQAALGLPLVQMTGLEPMPMTLAAHTEKVGLFLREMYATMVDPVGDFDGNIAEMTTILLETARRQRESDNALRNALAPFVAFLDAFERKRITGLDDCEIYGIHGGEHCPPYGASLKWEHLRAAREALKPKEVPSGTVTPS